MVNVYLHVVMYVSEGRKPFDESLQENVTEFTRTVLRYKGIATADVCVLEDHLHLLVKIPGDVDMSKVLFTVRGWLQDFVARHSGQPAFEWSNRILIASKSPCDVPAVRKFFCRQQEYHIHKSVTDEWNDLLDWDEIPYSDKESIVRCV